jgi:hypothetical protein
MIIICKIMMEWPPESITIDWALHHQARMTRQPTTERSAVCGGGTAENFFAFLECGEVGDEASGEPEGKIGDLGWNSVIQTDALRLVGWHRHAPELGLSCRCHDRRQMCLRAPAMYP